MCANPVELPDKWRRLESLDFNSRTWEIRTLKCIGQRGVPSYRKKTETLRRAKLRAFLHLDLIATAKDTNIGMP